MAELVEVRDDKGHFMKMKKYDGRYYVNHFIGNVKDHLAAIEAMNVRDDDTFVVSYPKSGTHWTYTIVNMLRKEETTYPGSLTFLDYTDMETLDNLPSPRVFATHMTFDLLPKQVKEGKGKIVTVFRNPKDVFTSLELFARKMDHEEMKKNYNTTWESFFEFFMDGRIFYGSWFDHIQSWDKVRREHKGNNIQYLIYEDMKQDLRSYVQKLALFLGVSSETEFLEAVTDKCTFRNMADEATKEFTPSEQWKAVMKDKRLPIYRKGEIGDWKNHFTVAQSDYFDEVYTEKMKNSSFTFRFV